MDGICTDLFLSLFEIGPVICFGDFLCKFSQGRDPDPHDMFHSREKFLIKLFIIFL